MTGANTFFGRRLRQRWARTQPQLHVVRLGRDASEIAEALQDEHVGSVVHLEQRDLPGVGNESNDRSEVAETSALLDACADAKVGRLVIPSSTMCYGPRLENPVQLSEDARLHGLPSDRWVSNRVQIELRVAGYREEHPGCDVTVLRHCWIVGPSYLDAVVRYFDADWVPTLLGYDPLLQFVHEDDVALVLEAAILESHPGVFNVVGEGVLPLSGYLRLADKWNVPTPRALMGFASNVPLPLSNTAGRQGFVDYLKYSWVASGRRAASEFGPRTYTSQEAWLAMIGARRMQQYRARN